MAFYAQNPAGIADSRREKGIPNKKRVFPPGKEHSRQDLLIPNRFLEYPEGKENTQWVLPIPTGKRDFPVRFLNPFREKRQPTRVLDFQSGFNDSFWEKSYSTIPDQPIVLSLSGLAFLYMLYVFHPPSQKYPVTPAAASLLFFTIFIENQHYTKFSPYFTPPQSGIAGGRFP